MVRGMTAAELVQHFSCGKSLPGFYVYDPASRIAFTPADCFSEVPCPIEFIARYHPKHPKACFRVTVFSNNFGAQ